jgi:very-short-patch-repair endonuclease
MSYTKNIDECIFKLNARKSCVVVFLKKYFKNGVDYEEIRPTIFTGPQGGANKIIYNMTNETYELMISSYRSRHIDSVNPSTATIFINKIMNLEQCTIGFICKCFKDFNIKRQYSCGIYKIDCYFVMQKIAIECDEFGHKDRDSVYEQDREKYIINTLKCRFIRFNPNEARFDLSNIICNLLKIVDKNLEDI